MRSHMARRRLSATLLVTGAASSTMYWIIAWLTPTCLLSSRASLAWFYSCHLWCAQYNQSCTFKILPTVPSQCSSALWPKAIKWWSIKNIERNPLASLLNSLPLIHAMYANMAVKSLVCWCLLTHVNDNLTVVLIHIPISWQRYCNRYCNQWKLKWGGSPTGENWPL